MSIKSTIWELEPHTEAKLTILKKYLNAWIPIITKYNPKVLYIDGFAGPGEYIGGKEGSPIVAINAFLNQKIPIKSTVKMIFVEADKERYDFLIQKIQSMKLPSNLDVSVTCDTFENAIGLKLEKLIKQGFYLMPTFAFIDPFGFTGIPLSIIENIMKSPKTEVLINFMYEEINRFTSLQKVWDGLFDTFGTDEWKKVNDEKEPAKRDRMLRDIYKVQLEKKAKAKYVRFFKMINNSNRTDYYLFFGTNDLTGLKKMKEAMWNVDKSGTFQFSDATYNPSQPTLFEIEPNYKELKQLIINKFKGKTVGVEEVELFVVVETPFRETHYKRQVLKSMEESLLPEIVVTALKNRRKGTYPEDTKIQFL